MDSPTAIERQASARLLDKRQQLEVSSFSDRRESGHDSHSEEDFPRRRSEDGLLIPIKEELGNGRGIDGKKAAGDSETRLIADSRREHSEEESDLP